MVQPFQVGKNFGQSQFCTVLIFERIEHHVDFLDGLWAQLQNVEAILRCKEIVAHIEMADLERTKACKGGDFIVTGIKFFQVDQILKFN